MIDGICCVKLNFLGIEALVLDKVLIEKVLRAAGHDLERVKDQGHILVERFGVAGLVTLRNLLHEIFDVTDGAHHIVGDRGLKELHELDFAALVLKKLVGRHVTEHQQQAFLLVVDKLLLLN